MDRWWVDCRAELAARLRCCSSSYFSIPTNKARCVSPIFSSVHHRKDFFLSEMVLNLCASTKKEKMFLQNSAIGPGALQPNKANPVIILPMHWEELICRTKQQIVERMHRSPMTRPACFCFFSIWFLFRFHFPVFLFLFLFSSFFHVHIFQKMFVIFK